MKTKVLSLSVLSIFIVAMFAVFVSAAVEYSPTELSGTGEQGDTVSLDLEISNTFSGDLNDMEVVFSNLESGSNTISSSNLEIPLIDSSTVIVGGDSLNVKLDIQIPSSQATGTYEGSFELFASVGSGDQISRGTVNITFEVTSSSSSDSFCSNGPQNFNDLRLKVDIDNRGEGDDDDWMPLDLIEIEVELENNKELDGDGDLDDVVFELGLFKKGSTSNIIDEMMWISKDDEEFEVGDIDDDGDERRHVFEFRVDPREVDDTNYILRVKAFPDGEESKTCIDFSDDLSESEFGSSSDSFADIEVSKENDDEKMVVVDEKSYPLVTNAFCGEQVSLNVDVYNIGDKDFEDQIKVTLTNKELEISEEEISSGDFDEGDKTSVNFLFKVPKDAQEKTYVLLMETSYDYDKDDEVYEEFSEDTFEALLKVEGNCAGVVPETSVSASLESGGKAGEELVVTVTVTNKGDTEADYLVNAAGFSLWASSVNVNPTSFTLNAGQSRDVLITLNVRSDASGEELFDIEVLSGNELAARQPVSVLIEGQQRGFLTGGAVGDVFGGNSYLWLLGLLNIILVVVIIIVAVRVMRK